MHTLIHLSNGSIGELAGAIVVRTSDLSVFDHGDSIDDLISHGIVQLVTERLDGYWIGQESVPTGCPRDEEWIALATVGSGRSWSLAGD